MAYTRGESKNIIVGAAALYVADAPLDAAPTETDTGTSTSGASWSTFVSNESYKDTLSNDGDFTNVGYTSNGLEISFEPDFGDVQVDQVLDTVKLYKQGMQVMLNTSFAEATLENLLVVLAYSDSKLTGDKATSEGLALDLSAGDIGECPVERGIIAIGPGTGDCAASDSIERVYIAYRALSIDNVTVSAKRDEPTAYEVSFRLLPEDTTGSYGKIVDRTYTP